MFFSSVDDHACSPSRGASCNKLSGCKALQNWSVRLVNKHIKGIVIHTHLLPPAWPKFRKPYKQLEAILIYLHFLQVVIVSVVETLPCQHLPSYLMIANKKFWVQGQIKPSIQHVHFITLPLNITVIHSFLTILINNTI